MIPSAHETYQRKVCAGYLACKNKKERPPPFPKPRLTKPLRLKSCLATADGRGDVHIAIANAS